MLSDFFAMGGYAAYVWPAYAVALALLVGLFVQSRRQARRAEAELASLRAAARPQRPRAARPLRPRRETPGAEPPVGEPG
ncbi:MAG: heme exporter protein CcmD [Geminicoccaceae bacterium]